MYREHTKSGSSYDPTSMKGYHYLVDWPLHKSTLDAWTSYDTWLTADRGGSKGGLPGLQPPSEPDFFIRPMLLSLKSPLISSPSPSPKSLLFSPPFVPILHPPLTADAVQVIDIENIWLCKDRALSQELKDTCLSFSLCHLLRRRFFGFAFYESSQQKTHDFVFKGAPRKQWGWYQLTTTGLLKWLRLS